MHFLKFFFIEFYMSEHMKKELSFFFIAKNAIFKEKKYIYC